MQVRCCVASRFAFLLLLLALPAAALAHGGAVTHADTPAELADGSVVRALSTAGAAGTGTGLPTSWCGTRLHGRRRRARRAAADAPPW